MTSVPDLTFAGLLRYHRLAAGLTQEELAERAHLSVDAISTLERGARRSPRKDTVTLLANALALAPDDRAALAAAARHSPATLAATPDADQAHDGQPASAATELPHGIVTFLFADIEGSSLLHQRLGDGYAEMLADVRELLHTIYLERRGHELGTQGDRFFAVFAHADDAVSAAVAAQRALAARQWPAGMGVRLRMGIHTGDALLTAGRYVGTEVARAARLAAAGHGGQVLLSPEVVAEVTKRGQELPPGTALRHLGRYRLNDLKAREAIIQIVLPDTPGLPSRFPPLRTLDFWPATRERLMAGALLTFILLALIGFTLPLAVPTFPRALGVVAGLGAVLLGAGIVGAALARQSYPTLLRRQWRQMRQPVVAVTSGLLSVVVVLTTLFITKPLPAIMAHGPGGYASFSYTYHQPTHRGGSIIVGTYLDLTTIAPRAVVHVGDDWYQALWNSCLVQLPDLSLGVSGWRADQCARVPTVANGDESVDGKTTLFRIDPRAVWSDGTPVTSGDFMFTFQLMRDPTIGFFGSSDALPWRLMRLTALDTHTVRIDWSAPYGDYLFALQWLTPLPLHAYARGKFAGVYDPATGAYNSPLAQQLVADALFNTAIPVDNGPFTLKSFVPHDRLVVVKNPHFFSNYFHAPALDQVTFVTTATSNVTVSDQFAASKDALIATYQHGGLTLALGLEPLFLNQLRSIPKDEIMSSPVPRFLIAGFNQRSVAPNAQANSGVSIFNDITVRQAFTEAFDRCAAMRAVLGIRDCNDPSFHTDELSAPPAAEYDPTVTMPESNAADAAMLMDRAGYHVVDGIRRYKDGKTPIKLILALSPYATQFEDIALRMQQDYARNLKVTVSIVNATTAPSFFVPGGLAQTGAFDIALWGDESLGTSVGFIANYGWDSASIPSAQNPVGGNFLGVIDPHVVRQDEIGSQIYDGSQRTEVYRELTRHVAQLLSIEPLFINADIALVKPTLCNFKQWPQDGFDLWNISDWYVAPTCP